MLTLGLGVLSPLLAVERWDRHWGTPLDEAGRCVTQTRDGGYVVGATRGSTAWCLKADKSGDTIWNFLAPWPYEYSVVNAMVETRLGDLVFAGDMAVTGPPDTSAAFLFKLTSEGQLVWDRGFGAPFRRMVARALAALDDGGFMLAGHALRRESTEQVAGLYVYTGFALRCDSGGNELWRRFYQVEEMMQGFQDVIQAANGDFVLCAWQEQSPGGDWDGLLIRTDSLGNIRWQRTYGGTRTDVFHSVRQTHDGGFVAAGATTSYGSGQADFYLVRTDSAGNERWHRSFGSSAMESCRAVRLTWDGGFILAGPREEGTCRGMLVKTDSMGQAQWTRLHGASGFDDFWNVQQTCDSGFIVTGYTFAEDLGDELWLVKTGPEGSADVTELGRTPSVESGPVLQMLVEGRIRCLLPRSGWARLCVYDPSGRRQSVVRVGIWEAGWHELSVPLPAAGLYFIRLSCAQGEATRTLPVVR